MDWSIHYPKFFPSPSEERTDGPSTSAHQKRVEFADVGCGFGGLLMALAPLFPETLMLGTLLSFHNSTTPLIVFLGMEIRVTVTQFVADKISALRIQHAQLASGLLPEITVPEHALPILASKEAAPGEYQNVSVIRANAMKFLPNFFVRGQVGMYLLRGHRGSKRTAYTAFEDILPVSRPTFQS